MSFFSVTSWFREPINCPPNTTPTMTRTPTPINKPFIPLVLPHIHKRNVTFRVHRQTAPELPFRRDTSQITWLHQCRQFVCPNATIRSGPLPPTVVVAGLPALR